MIVEEMLALDHPWCYLQQPAHPTAGLDASYRTLLAAIDQGWEIVDPIVVANGADGEVKMYHLTLIQPESGKIYRLDIGNSPNVPFQMDLFIR